MVKSKFIAFTTAFSMMASLGTGFITAQADDDVAVVNAGIELVYDADSSSETTKVINAYYKGADVIASAALAFNIDGVEVTDASYTTEWGGSKQFNKTDLANGNIGFSYTDTEATEPTTDKLAMTLTLTVAEDADFKVTMTNVDLMTNEFAEIKYSNKSADQSWVNVPAYNKPAATPTPIPTAEVNAGIDLVYDADSSSETTKVITAYYKGADVIASAALAFNVDGVEVTDASYTTEWGGSKQFNKTDLANGNIGFSYTDTEASEPTTDKIAMVLTLTVAENTEFKVTATNVDLMTNEFAEIKYSNKSADEAWVIVPKYVEESQATATPTTNPTATPTTAPTPTPTATPQVITRPTPVPTVAPTEAPAEATPIPTAEVNAGIELVYDADSSNETTKVINAYYKGADVIASAALAFNVDGVEVTDASYTTEWGGSKQFNKTDLANGNIGFSYTDTEASEPTTDKIAMVLTLTVAENTEFKVTATNVDLMTNEFAEIKYSNQSADEAWVIVPKYAEESQATATPSPTATPKPFDADTTVDTSKTIADGYADQTEEYGKLVGLSVEATKENGDPAEYGKDFVAVYDDKELTEDEYQNLINGYTDESIEDVVNGLTFKTKYGVSFATAPVYQTEAQAQTGEATVIKGFAKEVTAEEPEKPTPTPTPTTRPTTAPSGNSGGGGSSRGSTIASGTNSGTSSGGGVATAPMSFNDIDTVPWAVMAINALAGNGIVNGTSDTTFEPLAPVTRAQFTKMVCAAFSVAPIDPATARFTDVSQADWFYGYVEAAAAAGVVNGVSDTEFDPNALITREQMAAMMYRAMIATNASVQSGAAQAFTDAASISGYAVEAVNALSAAGVINGMDDGSFAPKEIASRAQAACIIFQYFQSLVR